MSKELQSCFTQRYARPYCQELLKGHARMLFITAQALKQNRICCCLSKHSSDQYCSTTTEVVSKGLLSLQNHRHTSTTLGLTMETAMTRCHLCHIAICFAEVAVAPAGADVDWQHQLASWHQARYYPQRQRPLYRCDICFCSSLH